MKIGIFGGAFNPPHIGHVNAAKTAILQHRLDKLIIIPTGTSPHKELPPGSPPPDVRLMMAKNAFSGLSPDIYVSDIEINSLKSNYTIDTIAEIQNKYTGSEFYLLVGNDMYDSLNTWKDSEVLLKLVTPILIPRDIIDISSTQIREMLTKRTGTEYISEGNYSLIIQHRYYNAKPDWDWLKKSVYAMLDPKRIAHVDGCEAAALKLAVHWGESLDDAREAAILHDITKKLDFSENMCIMAENGLVTNSYSKNDEKLLHPITAAIIAKTVYGVSDKVAQAIRLHTTGAAGMSMLDKIIYVADYIEQTRDFPGVENLRQAAFTNIDEAVRIGLEIVIDDLNARNIPVNSSTYDALNDITGSLSK